MSVLQCHVARVDLHIEHSDVAILMHQAMTGLLQNVDDAVRVADGRFLSLRAADAQRCGKSDDEREGGGTAWNGQTWNTHRDGPRALVIVVMSGCCCEQ